MIARLALASLLFLALAQVQGPPPGNPDHQQPPDGWYCRNFKNDPPSHKCECQRECHLNPDGTITEVEDRVKCRSNCFRDHCHCLSDSCDGHN